MSEQTPDTNNGISDGQDPSMEDILASIRKIIADDDGQSSDEVANSADDEAIDGDVAQQAHAETLDLDVITDEVPELDADIDALIGDMDAGTVETLDIPSIDVATLDDVLDLEIPMDEPDTGLIDEMQTLTASDSPDVSESLDLAVDDSLALDDEVIELSIESDDEIISRPSSEKPSKGLMGGAMAALGLGGAAATAKAAASSAETPDQDDLSLMLDNMLEDSAVQQDDAPAADERVIDPAEDLLAELDLTDDTEPEAATAPATDPDMDLVKSLMADLTEEPLHEDEGADVVAETETVDIDTADDADSDDVMDEILSMTLDDETKLSEELAIPEINAPAIEQAPAEELSLKEIAAQAEADAQSSDSIMGKGLAAAAGLGVVGATAIAAAQDDEPELDASEPGDIDAALSQLDDILADDTTDTDPTESITEETPPMARAKKTDAIIDEVTETATAGAFASLTNVVEEKATTAERGDRIGDLVMEALQPMLKEWLDANLKGIVERAVTKEVKRISSGK